MKGVISASNLSPSITLLNPSSSTHFHNYHSHHNIITFSHQPKHHYCISATLTNSPIRASDVLIKALEQEGVTHVFAYPGEASLEIHQALTRSESIKTITPYHEQGVILTTIGYAHASDTPGVCIATSGPGATNFVTGLAESMADRVPIIAITGQVPRKLMGTDAFQEVAITNIAKNITKHVYLILDPNDIPRVIKEAFFLAKTGCPGPVLIDIPKDVQQEMIIPQQNNHMQLNGYISRLSKPLEEETLHRIVQMIFEAKKPVLYIGGGCINASEEVRSFIELTGIPIASTLMGLGVFPSCDNNLELSLGMLGMHGTMYANYAVSNSDLLLAFGVRFDDRVTGEIETFASRAKIIHIDIDTSELGKTKQPHISIHIDIKVALHEINRILIGRTKGNGDYYYHSSKWRKELRKLKHNHPITYHNKSNNNYTILPQYAIEVLSEITKGDTIITTGVGQHQMFVAQYFKFNSPRKFLTSGGMGTMGFGLPAAIGAAIAKPGSLVVDVDGDGSFLMNVQELATLRAENLPIKIMILNNQHLGMVEQPQNLHHQRNKSCTYIENPKNMAVMFPDMVKFAKACGIPGEKVSRKNKLRNAIRRMLETPGPYLLDVHVTHHT